MSEGTKHIPSQHMQIKRSHFIAVERILEKMQTLHDNRNFFGWLCLYMYVCVCVYVAVRVICRFRPGRAISHAGK